MAGEAKPGTAPVTESEPQGVRFPEEELSDLEKRAGSQDQDTKAGEAGDDADAARKAEDAAVERLQGFMVKKGIKDVGALVDLAEGLERDKTKLSQDVQRLSAISPGPAPGYGAPRGPEPDDDIVLPENPIELVTNKETLKSFAKQLRDQARRDVIRQQEGAKLAEVAAAVQAKRAENPEEFDELRQSMYELSAANPRADINQLYTMAQKRRDAQEEAAAARLEKRLGLSGVDKDRLKGITSRLRTAPVSGGTGRQVDLSQPDTDKENAALLKAIADSDKF